MQSAINGDIVGVYEQDASPGDAINIVPMVDRLDYSMFGLPLLRTTSGHLGTPINADFDDDGNIANGLHPDGGVDINDQLSMLALFEAGDPRGDIADANNDPFPDGGVDISDLIRFSILFEAGQARTTTDRRFGWRGYQWDQYLGIYHVRSRVFDPKLMHWLQPDPLGEVDGPNIYAYCGWDPFNKIDPYGLMSDSEWHAMIDRNQAMQRQKMEEARRRGDLDPCTEAMLHYSMGQQDLAQEAVRANDREQNAMITKSAVAAIVTVATMGVGAPAAMGWAGTVAYGVGVGVATDAMGQGAALGLGYQDGWRWDETAFSGAGGGLGAAAGKGLGFGFRWAFGKGGVGRTAGPDGSRYSVAFETTLDPAVFSKGRGVHFNRANAALDAAMRSDDAFAWAMEGMMPGVGNRVSSAGGRKTPIGWTWHHAETHGVMQLVPRSQHTPGSIFWNTLHPGRRGGYSIWAIPAGAPRN